MMRIFRGFCRRLLEPVGYVLSRPRPYVTVFVHIPKCGGTTVNHHFYDNYYRRRICEFYVPGRHAPDGQALTIDTPGIPKLEEFRNRLRERQHQFDCVLGHLPFGVHRYFDRPCRYVTFVRDPVKRVWSSFNALTNLTGHYLHERVRQQNFDLRRSMETDWGFLFCNDQARMLLGTPQVNLTAADIPRVLEHVDRHYSMVALTESFEQDILEMGQQLGWRCHRSQKWNVGQYQKHPSRPSAELEQLIREHNAVDLALYEHVLAKRKSSSVAQSH